MHLAGAHRIVLNIGTIKVYGDPREGARVMGEAVARGNRRTWEQMPLSKMNERCVKKAATSCVAQMLGVVGNSLIKWGEN